jgi:hypothetical protein
MHHLQTLVPFTTLGLSIDAAPFGLKKEFILPPLSFILFFPGNHHWLLMPMVYCLLVMMGRQILIMSPEFC